MSDANDQTNVEVDALRSRCRALERELRQVRRQAEGVQRQLAETEQIAERNRAMMYRTHEALRAEIEERRRSEQALRDAMARATIAARTKDAFLANMSHELRTPLNGVMGMLEVVLGQELAETQRLNLQVARRSAGNLLTLLDDVLLLSFAEDGQPEPARSAFDPAASVRTVLSLFGEDRRIALNVPDTVPARLLGDGSRLRHIVRNLVSNAVKFRGEGHVSVELNYVDSTLCLEVADTGPGIEPEALAALFEPFVQGDDSSTRVNGGAGLGLTIVRTLVDVLGGELDLQSQVGSGTKVSVQLPMPPAAKMVVPHPPTGDGPMEVRVLLVEDHPVNQTVFTLMLRQLGVPCEVASNGREGLERWLERDFDVVFMDCQMPVMDGYEATRRIRAHGDRRQPRIVALTAHVLPHQKRRCLDVGMDAHMAKPPTLDGLEQALRRTIEARGRSAA